MSCIRNAVADSNVSPIMTCHYLIPNDDIINFYASKVAVGNVRCHHDNQASWPAAETCMGTLPTTTFRNRSDRAAKYSFQAKDAHVSPLPIHQTWFARLCAWPWRVDGVSQHVWSNTIKQSRSNEGAWIHLLKVGEGVTQWLSMWQSCVEYNPSYHFGWWTSNGYSSKCRYRRLHIVSRIFIFKKHLSGAFIFFLNIWLDV